MVGRLRCATSLRLGLKATELCCIQVELVTSNVEVRVYTFSLLMFVWKLPGPYLSNIQRCCVMLVGDNHEDKPWQGWVGGGAVVSCRTPQREHVGGLRV